MVNGKNKWCFRKAKQPENEISMFEVIYKVNNSDQNRERLHKIQAEYISWLNNGDFIRRQKARVKYEEEGDTNSK